MPRTAFCFDLDGTVTREEILPQIAKAVDLHEEINLLTQLTINGLIPFQNSFKLRVKLLETIPISRVSEIVKGIRLDLPITDFIRRHREQCFIITGNLEVWVKQLIEDQMGCSFYSSVSRHENDRLLGIEKIIEKAAVVKELRKDFDRVVAIGDGMNDCSMFQQADVGIAYGGTHYPVKSLVKLSDYVTFDSKSLVQILKNYL